MTARFDVAVVGAGILGLGHAAAALARGRSVVVIDRAVSITGASVRNFGHIGTSAHCGEAAGYAVRTNELWRRYGARAGFTVAETGTLVVARHEDEHATLAEAGVGRLLTAAEVGESAPVVGATGGAFLPGDLQVDPRTAAPRLAAWLAGEGVVFRWGTAALGVRSGILHTSRGEVAADAIIVAVGDAVGDLYPEVAAAHGLQRCALDMMSTDGVGLALPVLTGSTLLRYSAFASTLAARDVRARIARDEPDFLTRDVNQMYTERPDGALIVGDTHTVGDTVSPFQDEDAFRLLHRHAESLFGRTLRVRERWQGVYAKAPTDFLRAAPEEGVRITSVTTGIGMTTGLGLAEAVVDELLGEDT